MGNKRLFIACLTAVGMATSHCVLAAEQDSAYLGSGVEAKAVTPYPDYQVIESPSGLTIAEADREVTEKVIAALRADTRIKGRIEVMTLNGVVILAGSVDSVPMIYRAFAVTDRLGLERVRKISVRDLEKT